MRPTQPVLAPAVVAEYASALQGSDAKVPPVQSVYRFSRAADGKTRVDAGNRSVISNPATRQTILLDHVKKTATIQTTPPPVPPLPGMPQMPQFAPPGLPAAPKPPAVQVEDLGKRLLQGHEVEGKRFLIPPPPPIPALPARPAFQAPGMPEPPALPQMPHVPQPPHVPGAPKVPPSPTLAEVWHCPSLGLPMFTKTSGSFGQMTQVCQRAVAGEPHPAAFEIPAGYTTIVPPPPMAIPPVKL